jgi:hypothetical protein
MLGAFGAVRATEDTALKSISYRVPQCELLRLHRRGALREPRDPSQYGRGALPFRDVQPRDALLLRYDGEWHANYVPLPFCGARLLFLTFVYSIWLTEPPRRVRTTAAGAPSTEERYRRPRAFCGLRELPDLGSGLL